ncbi:hypothetical protein Plhal304r1_c057g0142751 [Plasmopara halstedii]
MAKVELMLMDSQHRAGSGRMLTDCKNSAHLVERLFSTNMSSWGGIEGHVRFELTIMWCY